ncbi:hypothetical protein [Paenibacillus sp. HW567]|uniref:hypothetical protein n=1 Tax=Paenibacillus sp. HW567 TaxID=1034769 RepID=UPI00036B8E67|nr:hypothetical protein [Paenibacillus sp. HW567]
MIISTVLLNDEVRRMVLEQTGEEIAVCSKVSEIPEEQLVLADVIIARNELFEAEILEKCINLKLLYIMSAGVDKLPFAELQARGIRVCNASGIHGQQ